MGRPREWLTAFLTRDFSTWLLWSYRRPFGFFFGLGVLPLAIISVSISVIQRSGG